MQSDSENQPAPAATKVRYDIMVICALLALLIFGVDVASPLGIAIGALYVTVVMFSLLSDAPRITWYVAWSLSALTIAEFFISEYIFNRLHGERFWILIVNRMVALFVIWMTAFLGVRLIRVKRQVVEHGQELERINLELHKIARHDSLTGIANRRSFDERLMQEFARATRDKAPIALLMIDVDFFKRFNDLNGHQAGDACLAKVAQAIQNSLRRPGDLVARYGGEEFAVILPGTSTAGAVERAEAIRKKIEFLDLSRSGQLSHNKITVSIGVATVSPAETSVGVPTTAKLIAAADAALYQAKQDGRNHVRAA